jgi:choline dehydrogenase-like flavoprotein
MTMRCQNLVIGSGPGGSVTAGLLAEHGRDVILIEEGPGDEAASCEPFSKEEMERRYRNRGLNPAMGSPKIAFVEGCCLGGGSEVNSGLYHRTPPEILEGWQRDYGLQGASMQDMLPHCQAVEQSLNLCYSPGPMPVASRILQQGAEALKWSVMELPRWVSYDTGKQNPDGSPVSIRMGLTRTWIPRARAAGARILTGTRISHLERHGNAWRASARNKEAFSIEADHVFLCCGPVQTPLLLRRAGIRHNVGNSLALHPTAKVIALFDAEVNYHGMGVPFHQVKQFAPDITFGCSVSSLPHMAMALTNHAEARPRILDRWKHAAVFYAAVRGPATGTVRPFPITGDPYIRYETGASALRKLSTGLADLCRLLFAAGATELFPTVPGQASYRSLDDLRSLPELLPAGTSLMTIHLFCSVPMGESRQRCAIDSWGRVFDAPGLSVHDASIFCDAPSVNPQGSVMAFAHRNTLRFLEG